MTVREIATGTISQIVEVGRLGRRPSIYCLFVGDVAVEVAGGYRVLGPEAHFWTIFELVGSP
jgi:hypothetical protein